VLGPRAIKYTHRICENGIQTRKIPVMSIIFKLDGKNVKQGQEEQTKRRTKDKDNIICSKS